MSEQDTKQDAKSGNGYAGASCKVTTDIRNRQEHIQFLENYISELTEKIDEITGERDIEKQIRSLEFRIAVLKESDISFSGKIKELETELSELKAHYDKIKPVLEKLEEERSYYRCIQGDIE